MEKVTRNPSILKNPICSISKTVSNFHVFVVLVFQIFDPPLQILFVAMGKQQIPTLDVYIVLQSLERYKDVKIWLTSKIVVLESFCYTRILPNPVNIKLLTAISPPIESHCGAYRYCVLESQYSAENKEIQRQFREYCFSLARLSSTHLITSLKVGILKIYQLERERDLSSVSSLIVIL